jgi:hypothetical protein
MANIVSYVVLRKGDLFRLHYFLNTASSAAPQILMCRTMLHGIALQRQSTEISKQILPEKEYWGLSPNFHIHVSVTDLYVPTIGLPILLEEICRQLLGLYKSTTTITTIVKTVNFD